MTVVSPFLRIIISYFLLIIKINSRHSLRKYQELNDINKEQIHLKIIEKKSYKIVVRNPIILTIEILQVIIYSVCQDILC